ncbi:AfsR/SARP family transcriptional regulator [Actinoalloteichus fjordicus]|uniref:DNA-binding transcriptional activator of the SARP family n=1 Tax=Actinoalloteichus fjordicus TaxID=1612552 RepID=A0AAC9LDS2_9PSEU|nr:BTAD domain-containing putative transcriptional regulator [Actinoalloteichus fjordicus]APU14837.1 DNA-binding transcriptional activator of the SARP family [Actinoalloteichus fjordicus]
MARTTDFRVLGPIELWTAGRRVDIGSPRRRSVLAALLVDANLILTPAVLIDRVWGEAVPPSARSALYSHLTRIRASLGELDDPAVLRRTSGGYLLDVDPELIDLHRFRRLAEEARSGELSDEEASAAWSAALGLWRGVPLAGTGGEWVEETRDRLTGERTTATGDHHDHELGRGRHVELLDELRTATARQPWDERTAGQYMLAAARSGRRVEALQHYDRLRNSLAEEIGVDPGPALQGLHASILRGESAPQQAPARRPAALPVPAQLPHDVPGFTGRTAELAALARRTTDGRRAVVVCSVDGTAGVGKTALTIHFAHHVAEEFPDGQLYVDLRGFDATSPPLAAADALGRFLRALGLDTRQVPVDAEEASALFRSMLAGRRMLIVLDNAATPDQVRPLLPATAASLVLITSRHSLVGLRARDGVTALTLDVLTTAESVELLRHIVGAARVAEEPAAATTLTALCGRLPLALRIAGERIAADRTLTLGELVAELTEESARLDVLSADGDELAEVRAVISWSYRGLDAPSARLFRLLSLHPGPEFGTEAAAALGGQPPSSAQPLLATLTGGHLLAEAGHGRYRFHDLVRLYAAEQVLAEEPPDEQEAARDRLLGWYLRGAHESSSTLSPHRRRAEITRLVGTPSPPHFADRAEALAWCQTERVNLSTAVRQAFDTGRFALAWTLAQAMWDFYYLRSHWADWLTTHRLGLTAARRAGDRIGEAGLLTSLGHVHWELGRYEEALRLAGEGLAVWRAEADGWGEGMALHIVAGALRGTGRPAESIEHYRRALTAHRRIENRWGEAWTLTSLGVAYRDHRRLSEALDVTEQARALWTRIGDHHGEGTTLNDLGDVHRELGDHEAALRSHRAAASVNGRNGNRWGEAWALDGIARTMSDLGRIETAREHWRQAASIFEELGDARAEEVRRRLAGG